MKFVNVGKFSRHTAVLVRMTYLVFFSDIYDIVRQTITLIVTVCHTHLVTPDRYIVTQTITLIVTVCYTHLVTPDKYIVTQSH